jgi:oligoendopeptidase F
MDLKKIFKRSNDVEELRKQAYEKLEKDVEDIKSDPKQRAGFEEVIEQCERIDREYTLIQNFLESVSNFETDRNDKGLHDLKRMLESLPIDETHKKPLSTVLDSAYHRGDSFYELSDDFRKVLCDY